MVSQITPLAWLGCDCLSIEAAFNHQDERGAGNAERVKAAEKIDSPSRHLLEHRLIEIAFEIRQRFGSRTRQAQLVIRDVHVGVRRGKARRIGSGDEVASKRTEEV